MNVFRVGLAQEDPSRSDAYLTGCAAVSRPWTPADGNQGAVGVIEGIAEKYGGSRSESSKSNRQTEEKIAFHILRR